MNIRGSPVAALTQRVSKKSCLTRSATKERKLFGQALQHNANWAIDDGKTILCDWYSDDDTANPQNWSTFTKAYVLVTISIYACTIYMAASLFTPDSEAFDEEFGTGHAYTSLGIGIYVLGYGCGPLLFGPLSEISAVGRNWPYLVSYVLFILVSIPTALVQNESAFMFLRFLQGFCGSPALTTGGASLADVYDQVHLPYAMTVWVVGTFCAPAIGPIISGFALPVLGWRFTMWEVLLSSVPTFVMLLFLPETSGPCILYRRAAQLRRITGNSKIKTKQDASQPHLSPKQLIFHSFVIPLKITIMDPAMLFTNLYMALVYSIFYSFFECFPLTYQGIYHFNLGEMGCTFLSWAIGSVIAFVTYNIYLYTSWVPTVKRNDDLGKQEDHLKPALLGSLLPPIGLLVFGWTARPDIHWIISQIGVVIYPAGIFVLLQTLFLYISVSYPQYSASLLGLSEFTRGIFACVAVVIARPLFLNLGLGPACSLLAGLTSICVGGIFFLYHYGEALRKRSRFIEA